MAGTMTKADGGLAYRLITLTAHKNVKERAKVAKANAANVTSAIQFIGPICLISFMISRIS